jgi:TonB family protein
MQRIFLSLIIIAYTTVISIGQDVPIPPPPMDVSDDEAFNTASVQHKPEFPGGDAAMFQYLANNIKYPTVARDNGIQGKVIISFIVAKSGAIEDVQVVRGIGGGCDQEGVRVVKSMPKWKPGMNDGKPVKVKFTLPLSFKLEGDGPIVFALKDVDTKPGFPDGEKGLNEYIAKNTKYPANSKKNKQQGTVIINFVIDQDGKVYNPMVKKGITPELDAEALRVIKSMPNWTPAIKNGKPVNVLYEVPISFKLKKK